MTAKEIQQLDPKLDRFLDQFLFCCAFTQTFRLFVVYCRALLTDLPRKTCEPIALFAGVAVRTLQQFLKDHKWSYKTARRTLAEHVLQKLPHCPDPEELGTIGLVDETATLKKGKMTPGVQRQYCGELGKKENCIVTVHLGVCKGQYKTLIDADLFLPQSWSEDRSRCEKAGIDKDIVYRPKWQIALEQIDRGIEAGIDFDSMTFDEGYGSKPKFLAGLDERNLTFVGEVPKSFRCRTAETSRQDRYSRADHLVRHSRVFHQSEWQSFELCHQTLGPSVWHYKAQRVYLPIHQSRTYWLIWAKNPKTAEQKYFLSNACENESTQKVLKVAFVRWNIEHCFRVSKSELGFRHFEGRNYTALMRHLMLSQMMLTFVADQTLEGKKKPQV